jgi:hypothetical protein
MHFVKSFPVAVRHMYQEPGNQYLLIVKKNSSK